MTLLTLLKATNTLYQQFENSRILANVPLVRSHKAPILNTSVESISKLRDEISIATQIKKLAEDEQVTKTTALKNLISILEHCANKILDPSVLGTSIQESIEVLKVENKNHFSTLEFYSVYEAILNDYINQQIETDAKQKSHRELSEDYVRGITEIVRLNKLVTEHSDQNAKAQEEITRLNAILEVRNAHSTDLTYRLLEDQTENLRLTQLLQHLTNQNEILVTRTSNLERMTRDQALENNELTEIISQSRARIKTLTEKKSELESELAAVKSQMETLEKDSAARMTADESKISELHKDIGIVKTEKIGLKKKIEELTREHSLAICAQSERNKKLNDANKTNETQFNTEILLAKTEIKKLQDEIIRLTATKEQLDIKFKKLREEHGTLTVLYNASQDSLKEKNKNLQYQQQKYDELCVSINLTQKSLAELNTSKQAGEKEIEQLTLQLISATEAVSALTKQISTLQDDKVRSKEELLILSAQITKLKAMQQKSVSDDKVIALSSNQSTLLHRPKAAPNAAHNPQDIKRHGNKPSSSSG